MRKKTPTIIHVRSCTCTLTNLFRISIMILLWYNNRSDNVVAYTRYTSNTGRGRIDTRERRCGHNDMRELCLFKLYLMNMSDYNNSRVWNLWVVDNEDSAKKSSGMIVYYKPNTTDIVLFKIFTFASTITWVG